MTTFPLAELRETVNSSVVEPLSPSPTPGESMETVGVVSSSVIVPVPVEIARAAFSGFSSVTTTVSSGSLAKSPVTETVMLFVVSPAAKVRAPAASAA